MVKVQHHREIRIEAPGGDTIELDDPLHPHSSDHSLVDRRGVRITIRQHHLAECQSRTNDPLHVIAPCRSGKTSLVARFVHSLYSDRYQTTIGVKIDKKVLEKSGDAS